MMIVDVISALFILLFLYAAVTKIMDYQRFSIELAKSPILNAISKYVSIMVPLTEFIIVMLLLIKRTQYFALYACLCLMAMFSFYILMILNFSEYIPCSCGGILENMTWREHFEFNLGFIFLAIAAILLHPLEELICSKREGLRP